MNVLKYPSRYYYGIAILNIPNEVSIDFLIKETEKVLTGIHSKDFKGNLIIVESGKMKIRKGQYEKPRAG